MKPIIGLTCGVDLKTGNYYSMLKYKNINAISRAGGTPIMLPACKQDIDSYIDIVDGIYFSGGPDINPMFFNEDPINGLGRTNIIRDEFEIELFKKAYEKKLPILGICRGIQVINVAAGGTIYQDLQTQFKDSICHAQGDTPFFDYFHKVNIEKESRLYNIHKKTEIYTNTIHHQGVKELAQSLKPIGRTNDGLIEAFESRDDRYILAVQWHPENMYEDHNEFMGIFNDFVGECIKQTSDK